MLIAAVAVGALAAYYFGLQAGIWAAAAAAALVLAAMVPGLALYAYGVLAVGVGAIAWLGPKLKRPNSAAGFVMLGKEAAKRAAARVKAKLR
jgi:hypothetical protein